MADRPSITVDGLDELVRALGRLSPDLQAELKTANRELAAELVPVARAEAPRRDGDLWSTIRAGATKRSGVVRAGTKAVPYAGPIHFGWPARQIEPRPFLWDALDSRRAELEQQYIERVTRIVEAVR